MATADEVVKLVAEVAVADVRFPEIGRDVKEELDGGKEKREAQGALQGGIGGADDRCMRRGHAGFSGAFSIAYGARGDEDYFLTLIRHFNTVVHQNA
jgi:hypothetical protein